MEDYDSFQFNLKFGDNYMAVGGRVVVISNNNSYDGSRGQSCYIQNSLMCNHIIGNVSELLNGLVH